ncbi:hypothetical protein BTVI_76940 [Pitangus sulphuratus]|nr:hypothetical protein BTVI_76940 [Pitangus sulphuratus]
MTGRRRDWALLSCLDTDDTILHGSKLTALLIADLRTCHQENAIIPNIAKEMRRGLVASLTIPGSKDKK